MSETRSAVMNNVLNARPESQLFCGATLAMASPAAQYNAAE